MDKYTLSDRLVRETIILLSELNSQNPTLGLMVVGGIACQTYADSPEFYRPTKDIDTFGFQQLSKGEFKELFAPLTEKLIQNGYDLVVGNTRYGHEIRINGEENLFYIHVNKFSPAYVARHWDWKQRELDNATSIQIDGTSMRVHRLEDLLANKARRLGKLVQEGYVTGENLCQWYHFLEGDFEIIALKDVFSRLKRVVSLRNQIKQISSDLLPQHAAQLNQYKAEKDSYDILVLSRAICDGAEFRESYFWQALSTVPSI